MGIIIPSPTEPPPPPEMACSYAGLPIMPDIICTLSGIYCDDTAIPDAWNGVFVLKPETSCTWRYVRILDPFISYIITVQRWQYQWLVYSVYGFYDCYTNLQNSPAQTGTNQNNGFFQGGSHSFIYVHGNL